MKRQHQKKHQTSEVQKKNIIILITVIYKIKENKFSDNETSDKKLKIQESNKNLLDDDFQEEIDRDNKSPNSRYD